MTVDDDLGIRVCTVTAHGLTVVFFTTDGLSATSAPPHTTMVSEVVLSDDRAPLPYDAMVMLPADGYDALKRLIDDGTIELESVLTVFRDAAHSIMHVIMEKRGR